MKLTSWLPAAALIFFFSAPASQAQPVLSTDGPPINDYLSLGEFEQAGNLQGWKSAGGGANPTLKVANGVLLIATTSSDPWFYRQRLTLPAELTTVEIRLKLVAGPATGWEMFWGSSESGQGGFSGNRGIDYKLPTDGGYHLLQFDMARALNGATLTDLRIDSGDAAGVVAEVDYVRVGTISPDSDSDGLPDSVETKTGVYVGPRDTGTNPTKADTDGDGVNDSIEVTFGTDPNNAAQFPVPSIKYAISEAVYVVAGAIQTNVPSINNGTTTSFAVAPALPAGLTFNKTDGRISGTPAAAVPATDYVITANFVGGKTATETLKIEVRNPYVEFAVSKFSTKVGQAFGSVSPIVRGPAPQSFQITPTLPDGLNFAPSTGEVSGTPTAYTVPKTYTVSAIYSGYPKSEASLSLSVLENPALTVDPTDSLLNYWSFGEYEDPADTSGFFRNSIAPFSVAGGALEIQTTGFDPYFGKSFTLDQDYRIWEFRMKVTAGSPIPLRFYWAEDVPGRNNLSEMTAFSIFDIKLDGAFHTYRVDFTKATEARFTTMRFDPGVGADNGLEFDYIHVGGFPPRLSTALQANGSLQFSWPSTAAGFVLQSAPAVTGSWTNDSTPPVSSGNQLVVTVKPQTGSKFYRLIKAAP